MTRVFNFAAGPGILPLPVLEEVAANLVDYHGQGMSLLEMSHRGAIFSQIIRETKDLLRELCSRKKVRAVGEIGLDYHFDAEDDIEAAPHDVQMSCMARQLAVAVERDLPVELHLRNDPADDARAAHADAYRVLQEVGVPKAGCVLHCFGEDRATMERFVGLGCSIAFGGAATFKGNEEVREAFAAAPLDPDMNRGSADTGWNEEPQDSNDVLGLFLWGLFLSLMIWNLSRRLSGRYFLGGFGGWYGPHYHGGICSVKIRIPHSVGYQVRYGPFVLGPRQASERGVHKRPVRKSRRCRALQQGNVQVQPGKMRGPIA